MNKDNKLKKSKTFCIAPWITTYVTPSDDVLTCCVADWRNPIGIINEEITLKHIWNNSKYCQLRKDMLAGKIVKNCTSCYELDENKSGSMREYFNDRYAHHWDKVLSTNSNGSVDYFELPYIDVRWSNICNFKCRMCGGQFSSSWLVENKKYFPELKEEYSEKVGKDGILNASVFDDIIDLLPMAEDIYFAGGEPLMHDEHYQILDYLIENDLTHINLRYSTNLSQLTYKKKNIFDYWKKFETIDFIGSIDGMESRAEYIRHGTKWNVVKENALKITTEFPQHSFMIACTLSVYNSFHIIDLCKSLIEEGIIKPENIIISMLVMPEYLRLDILPQHIKDELVIEYEKMILWLQNKYHLTDISTSIIGFRGAINTLKNKKDEDETLRYRQDFIKHVKKLDRIRNEKFEEIFPELTEIFTVLDEKKNGQ